MGKATVFVHSSFGSKALSSTYFCKNAKLSVNQIFLEFRYLDSEFFLGSWAKKGVDSSEIKGKIKSFLVC